MDGFRGQSQLSARQKEILYTFNIIDAYAEDLYLEPPLTGTEALLRQCEDILPELAECQCPFSADTWKGLGEIRDGFMELVEEKFGADDSFLEELNFESLDSEEKSSLSRKMNLFSQYMPSYIADIAKTAISIIKAVLPKLDSMPGGIEKESQLSDRQKQIMYTFAMIHTYGEDLDLKVSPAETEALLHECENMLPKVTECHGPIDADTWEGLGKIRDGVVDLIERNFEAGHEFPDKLKFETLDSMENSSLSRSMNIIRRNAPSSTADIAKTAIVIIKDIIRTGKVAQIPLSKKEASKSMKSDPTTPGGLGEKSQMSARQKQIMHAFVSMDEYGSGLHLLLKEHNVTLAETEALLRECRNMLPKVSDHRVPISDDVWKGLGRITDGLLDLVEQKLGAEHNLSKTMDFDRLDSKEYNLLSGSMNRLWESAPGIYADSAKYGILNMIDVLSDLESRPGESKVHELRLTSAAEVKIMYTLEHTSIYGSCPTALLQDHMPSLQVTIDAERLLRECRKVLSKLSPRMEQISADVWEELGTVRDHFVRLVDQTLGVESISKKLRLDSLDSKDRSSYAEGWQQGRACTGGGGFEATSICNSLHIIEAIYSDMAKGWSRLLRIEVNCGCGPLLGSTPHGVSRPVAKYAANPPAHQSYASPTVRLILAPLTRV